MDSPGVESRIAVLERAVEAIGRAAVAVSGGVDSMTLAVVAHRALGESATMIHAVSAAVPTDATQRVERYARRDGWRLERIDAGEMLDARYLTNPVNRCYFCKTNLYSTIAPLAGAGTTIVSGTNTDDLADFRPGLAAAAEHAVRHPYVECGIGTSPRYGPSQPRLGLHDLAELPAAPCLSSRVETGIAIDPEVLKAVDACERLVRDATGAAIGAMPCAPRCGRGRARRRGDLPISKRPGAPCSPARWSSAHDRGRGVAHHSGSSPTAWAARSCDLPLDRVCTRNDAG